MDNPQAFLARLKPIHIFKGLQDAEILDFAAQLESVTFAAGAVIFEAGADGDAFYILDRGRVSVARPGRPAAQLEPGDYFGEGSLLYGRRRSATVTAVTETQLLRLTREAFDALLARYPELRPNLLVEAHSRELYARTSLNWLEDNEYVHLLARRHPMLLWQTLILPAAAQLGALGLAGLMFSLYDLEVALVTLLLLGLPALGWIAWTYLDWTNDLYIVTNQRVVYVEKVIGIYDSREEAPLRAIQSVTINTAGALERALGIGDVVVRTLSGAITLRAVSNPAAMAALVEEHWNRAKTRQRETEQEALKIAVRRRIGLPTPPPPPPPPLKPRPRPNPLGDYFSFSVRLERGSTITYRKHWYVLIQGLLQPSLFLLADVGLVGLGLAGMLPGIPLTVALLVAGLAFLPLAFWWWYQYEDWRNDLYQVTPDQIVDVYKRPFGQEVRKAAPLANVLSLKYERPGLLGLLLNYGVVTANVAGQVFDFEGVFDPRGVQNDVYRRIEALTARKSEAEAARRREELADWVGMYHRVLSESTRDAPPPSLPAQPPADPTKPT